MARYVPTRILLSKSDAQEKDGEALLLCCLTERDIYILRNIVQYAERRVNWATEYNDAAYEMPVYDDEVFSWVADTEWRLTMAACIDFSEIIDELHSISECVCSLQRTIQNQTTVGPALVENGQAEWLPGDEGGLTPTIDDECEYANLVYEYLSTMWDFALGAMDLTSDICISAIIALMGVGTGGASAPFLGLLYTIAQGIHDMMEETEIQDAKDRLASIQDDIVCAVYDNAGNSYATIQAAIYDVITTAGFSYLEGLTLRSLCDPYFLKACNDDIVEPFEWFLNDNIDDVPCTGCSSYADCADLPTDTAGWSNPSAISYADGFWSVLGNTPTTNDDCLTITDGSNEVTVIAKCTDNSWGRLQVALVGTNTHTSLITEVYADADEYAVLTDVPAGDYKVRLIQQAYTCAISELCVSYV